MGVALAISGILGALIGGGTPAPLSNLDLPPPVVVPQAPPDAHPQSVGLARMTATIETGTPWAVYAQGRRAFQLRCAQPPSGASPVLWHGDVKELTVAAVRPILARELKLARLVSSDDPDELFNTDHRGDLLIGGNLKYIAGDLCLSGHHLYGNNGSDRIVIDPENTTGRVVMTIEWQVYSNSQRKVVLTKTVYAGADYELREAGVFDRLIDAAIRENIRGLLADAEFQNLVLTSPEKKSAPAEPRTPLNLAGSLAAKTARISDAVGAVVLVMTGDGHGSGVLVSSDGYVLTDDHVVGAEKYVKIRWSDGLEGLGEVIRTDKRRDVALIKTDPRGRQPLALRTQAPEPGDTVFAIGAPEDPKLQSTVTRGVVSAANRIVDGFSFIQSDVTVNPGNSGGPLLDEKGEVLGLTDWKLQSRDNATGLNFFTPIGDALAFLSLEQR